MPYAMRSAGAKFTSPSSASSATETGESVTFRRCFDGTSWLVFRDAAELSQSAATNRPRPAASPSDETGRQFAAVAPVVVGRFGVGFGVVPPSFVSAYESRLGTAAGGGGATESAARSRSRRAPTGDLSSTERDLTGDDLFSKIAPTAGDAEQTPLLGVGMCPFFPFAAAAAPLSASCSKSTTPPR